MGKGHGAGLAAVAAIALAGGVIGTLSQAARAAAERDFALRQLARAESVFSALVVLFNLVADILYGWLDPRISYR